MRTHKTVHNKGPGQVLPYSDDAFFRNKAANSGHLRAAQPNCSENRFIEKPNQYHMCCFGILHGMICHICSLGVFAIISTHPTCTKTTNYPEIKLVGRAFELSKRMENSRSCAHVLHKTLNFVISRVVLQKTAAKCTKTKNARAERLFFLIKPIVLRCSRCCRRRRCFSCLIGSFSNDDGDGNENATKQ